MSDISWPKRRTGKTWEGLEKGDPQIYWQHLRSLRVKGCGFAETDALRRGVLRAALQQAEQLFGAAEAVDYSARPLLAFYGLSQACLAVIQASPRVVKQNASPNGHGMKFEPSETGVGTLTDAGDSRGTLALLKQATDSGGLGTVSVEQLWSMLPEHATRGFNTIADMSRCPLYLSPSTQPDSLDLNIHVPDVTMRGSDFASTFETLSNSFPILGTLDLSQGRPGDGWQSANNGNGFNVYAKTADRAALRRTLAMKPTYYDTLNPRLFVSLDGDKAVHPLVVWLSILFSLSMQARYRPERWAALLQIDGNSSAPLLEDILQCANTTCPALILNTLDHMQVLFDQGIRPS